MTTAQSNDCKYNPVRFWWTERIAWGSLALVVLIVALWGSATVIAQRRLDKLIESYRAAGEPVYAEDFNVFNDIPDEDNAATYYKQAEEAYVWPASFPIEFSVYDLIRTDYSDAPEEHASKIEHYVSTNAVTIELLKKGGDCEHVTWRDPFTDPFSPSGVDDVLAPRRLCQMLSASISVKQAQHRFSDVLDLLYAQVRVASHRTSKKGIILDHLVTTSITMISCEVIENVSAKLLTDGWIDDGPHLRKRMRQIISELLDENAYAISFQAGLVGERVILLDLYETIPDGKPISFVFSGAPRSLMFMIRPTLISHCRRVLESVDQVIAASHFTTYPKVMSKFDLVTVPTPWKAIDELLADFVTRPGYGETMTVEFSRLSRRRMAAIALAIRMFEIEHGHRPKELDDLVPTYLQAVPRDPFAKGRKPIGYLPDAESPILYCVGKDGIDNGGKVARKPWGAVDTENLDVPFFLNGDKRPPHP
jgi:hypothetical protein